MGFSILSCVPIAIKPSVTAIVAGFKEVALKPDTLPLPYLNLNPPDFEGCPKIGLPATKSLIYVGEPSAFPLSLFSCILTYSSKKSKPVDCIPFFFALPSNLNPFAAF